jgi:hypothetical protein
LAGYDASLAEIVPEQTDESEHRHTEEDTGDAADLSSGEDAEDHEQGM